VVVSPTATSTYTLSATSAGGTVTRQVTVTVVQPPAISAFYASPSSIYQGSGSTLAWSVAGATTLALDNGIGAVTGTSSRAVSPSGTTTYTLTATATLNGVSVIRTAQATLSVSPQPTVPTIQAFTADATTLGAGAGTTLRWSVANAVGAVTVTLNGTTVGASSTQATGALGSTTTYTLVAVNTLDTTKTVSANVAVTVVQVPVISFTGTVGGHQCGQCHHPRLDRR